MVTLVSYGLGNVQAFVNIYRSQNVHVEVAETPEALSRAERIILPGVGAFDWAMTRLNASGLRDTLETRVVAHRVPVLGVCVGMQMMAHGSTEGELAGLGWVDADVVRLEAPPLAGRIDLPHMGWNDVQVVSQDDLFLGIEHPQYYFLHSYVVNLNRKSDTLATASYGSPFAAALRSGHIFGTQFHPEKSHQWGVDLLLNFSRI